MSEPPRQELPDELPRSAIADPLLSPQKLSRGPRGLRAKIGLAALGLVILFAMVAAVWAALQVSPKPALQKPPAQLQAR
ncbi:MAG: hypothetical protein JWP86_1120 [Phenylobacterium sp.]|nr:hypothetical protein [Phenylobacterium sp.]MDB5493783.1 hypothetical protein [Phenylobacterium sp.]